MKFLVIPSIREHLLLNFFESWQEFGDWDAAVVVEDNPTKTFKIKESTFPIHHVSHKEIKQILKKDAWIISKKDSACRTFGFLLAKQLGAEWILSLDDDTRPYQNKYICEEHLKTINSFTVCTPSAGVRTRGLPYLNLGKVEVVCNMGLWTKNGDWDAVQSLSCPELANYFTPNIKSFLAHPCQRYPFCGMNIFFNTKIVPAMYFPLMGQNILYSRYDDIWCGWLFQKVLEHLKLCWSIGEPFIEHSRASNMFQNLVKEAPGYKLNEQLWEIINEVNLNKNSLPECVEELGIALESNSDSYISKFGTAVQVYSSASLTIA